jgi:hypothetical protein
VHHSGERIPLLEPLTAKRLREVGAECRNVCRAAGQQNAVDVRRLDPGVIKRDWGGF